MSGDDAVVIGGKGIVGQATMKSLNIPHYFDLKESNITLEEAAKKLFIFFCLPTPTDSKGGQEKSIKAIKDYVSQIKQYGGRNIFVIRSTVIPGTCKAIAEEFGVMVASNPELLSEDTWERDAVSPRLIIIGADDVPSRKALENIWKSVKGKNRVVVDTVTAEMMKYTFNMFFITKIVFANQIFDVCETAGANYKQIREALMAHPWGSKHHLKPVHKEGRGGGGHCFPKDIAAFTKWSNLELMETVQKLNKSYLRKSKKK